LTRSQWPSQGERQGKLDEPRRRSRVLEGRGKQGLALSKIVRNQLKRPITFQNSQTGEEEADADAEAAEDPTADAEGRALEIKALADEARAEADSTTL
jgi:hypothetical protein